MNSTNPSSNYHPYVFFHLHVLLSHVIWAQRSIMEYNSWLLPSMSSLSSLVLFLSSLNSNLSLFIYVQFQASLHMIKRTEIIFYSNVNLRSTDAGTCFTELFSFISELEKCNKILYNLDIQMEPELELCQSVGFFNDIRIPSDSASDYFPWID